MRLKIQKRQVDVTPSLPIDSSTPVTPSSTTLPPPASSTTPPASSTTQSSSPASSNPASSSIAPPSSSTIPPSTTTTESTSVVIISTTLTVSGSTITLASSSASVVSSAVPVNQGGGGLSSGAKAGIIGGVCGVGGAIILAIAGFFLYRYIQRRRSDYVPDQDELRWPEVTEDSGALFPAAVKRNTGSHGLGRDNSVRSTTTGYTPTTASAAYTAREPPISEYGPPSEYSHMSEAGNGVLGLGAGAAAAGMYGHQQSQSQGYNDYRQSYVGGNYNEELGDQNYASSNDHQYNYSDYPQTQQYGDHAYAGYQTGLDRAGTVTSDNGTTYNRPSYSLHVANPSIDSR